MMESVGYSASGEEAKADALGEQDDTFQQVYEEKRHRLEELEREAEEMRHTLATTELEIGELREELGLTTMAQLRKSMQQSAAYQKTVELGERVSQSEGYQKTTAALNAAGDKTSAVLENIGAKTTDAMTRAGTAWRESETVQSIGNRWRTATFALRAKLGKNPDEQTFSTTADDLSDDAPSNADQ